MRLPLTTLRLSFLLLLPVSSSAQIQLNYTKNQTPQWHEVIEMYQQLDHAYPQAKLVEAGTTDAGKPLHLFIISGDATFTPGEVHASDKRIILINNGIHPGESNGIDASLEFAADLLSGNYGLKASLENTVILIVPVLNVG
jgi:hypothetical protein